jgi:hypothetical protein
LKPKVGHPFGHGVFPDLVHEGRYDDGGCGFAEVGFNVDAMASDRWRTDASMTCPHDHRVPLFLDLGP